MKPTITIICVLVFMAIVACITSLGMIFDPTVTKPCVLLQGLTIGGFTV